MSKFTIRSFRLLLPIFLLFGCQTEKSTKPAKQIFEETLTAKKIPYKITKDGLYLITVDDVHAKVSLDNIEKNYFRDHSPETIRKFVDQILSVNQDFHLPPWAEAQKGIRLSLERSGTEFGDTIKTPLTEKIVSIVVYVSADETKMVWVDKKQLQDWNIAQPELLATAHNNMADLLRSTKIAIEPMGSSHLGYFDSDSPFKAALILSPNLKEQLPKEMGWPILAVVPTRDFAYFIKDRDTVLMSQIGPIVIDEFIKSVYPISNELLRISDQGVEVIGDYDLSSQGK